MLFKLTEERVFDENNNPTGNCYKFVPVKDFQATKTGRDRNMKKTQQTLKPRLNYLEVWKCLKKS